MMDFSMFEDISFPKGEIITLGNTDEEKALSEYFSNRKISDISLNSLKEEYKYPHNACLCFMAPRAYAFFLPAFMKLAINDTKGDTDIPWVVVSCNLLAIAEGKMKKNLEAILISYSKTQLQAITVFLKIMSNGYYKNYEPEDDAQTSLDIFWGRFI